MVAKPDITKTDPATTTPGGPVPPPVKRRPGRPRKHPLPAPVVTPDTVAAEVVPTGELDPPPEAPVTRVDPLTVPADERIGVEVDPRAEAIGFDDGRTYRCDGGVIVERLT